MSAEIRDAALQVHAAQERLEDRDFLVGVLETVERLGTRWRALLASLDADARAKTERALGRRVADIQRLASLLPRVPTVTSASTPDRRAGAGAVGERRITGVSWTPHARNAPTGGPSVGGEIEAWCGKCGDLKTHHIVAMVGGTPKQVICQVCNSRHTFRTEAARRRPTDETPATAPRTDTRTGGDPEAAKRAQVQRALAEELANATDVRAFDPKERYRSGDIISHPEYGRGKVENVLRSSVLVRFSRAGLKPLTLY